MKWLPVLTIIGSGIAVSNTKAWIEAITGKKSGFVRTPKMRLENKSDVIAQRARYNIVKFDKVAFLEFLMGAYVTLTIAVAAAINKPFVIPFLILYASGFFYISFFTLYDAVKQNMMARKEADETVDFL